MPSSNAFFPGSSVSIKIEYFTSGFKPLVLEH
jgi:hypothetical protein